MYPVKMYPKIYPPNKMYGLLLDTFYLVDIFLDTFLQNIFLSPYIDFIIIYINILDLIIV